MDFYTEHSVIEIKYQTHLYVICHLLSFLLDDYYATTQTGCNRDGNARRYYDLDAAKDSCLADNKCLGLMDRCGNGDEIYHCSAPLVIKHSTCASVVYQHRSK